ncbi:tRNA pseudouridine(32) synthase [Maritalea myrionectae]|uniref:Dual-specificity RNA pseudouridine synthase RluA n=1 Tax=Maritalea myrionectae TaxID=454601 RepID=A0A2R4MCS2_9HYPH|nr:pseudouridine synthase [Maritalea myrionectae]AVX03725.1 tRNA pseudouridine(32) synthase [Maritalea myrionectae]
MPPRPAFDYRPPQDALNIVFEDDHLLVVDKPSGLLSVPGKAEHLWDCLEYRAQQYCPDARIIHRLDMDTSGILILAKNAAAHRHIGLQFERRHTSKIYQALAWGQAGRDEGLIDLPLRCDWPNRPLQIVDFANGKSAQTRYQVLQRNERTSRFDLFPITGRSHQLRVHLLALGHPILGDDFYAPAFVQAASDRLCLHARYLEIHHPIGGERISFGSEVPF